MYRPRFNEPVHIVGVGLLAGVSLLVAILGAGCGGRRRSTPPAPAPVVAAPPSLACPADMTGEARVGKLPAISFDLPAPEDGEPPVMVDCAPPPGSDFEVGTTMVTCEATDRLSRKTSCTFSVVVAPIPQIQKTRFMAFGDSITEGKVGLMGTGVILPGNYAQRLQLLLSARYELQTFTMVNEGQGSEKIGDGKWRLGPAFQQSKPEVLLLLEGTNDLIAAQDRAAIDSAVDGLQSMVRQGKAGGAQVFIATLPPMNGQVAGLGGAAAGVPVLNDRIRSMAAGENVALVDLYEALPLNFIGPDGKHPTSEGHQKIAETFLAAIRATLEVKPPQPPQTAGPVPARR